MGFLSLDTGAGRPSDGDIPLTKIPTSGSTGARKPNQGIEETMGSSSDSSEKEKGGLFGRGVIGRRKVIKKDLSATGRSDTLASSETTLNAMGRLYQKVIGWSVVTRYLVYIVPVALVLAIPIIVVIIIDPKDGERTRLGTINDTSSVPSGVIQQGPLLRDLFVWIEASWLSLWAGKIVAHFLPFVFMFFCGVVSSGTRKYATVIRALEIPLSLFFWFLATWLIFIFVIAGGNSNDPPIPWVKTMLRILGASFVSSAVFLGEKTLVQLISITYHQRSFANRIKDSKREVFLLGLLYDASRQLFPMYCPEFIEEDTIINDSIDLLLGGHRGKNSGSATPMKLIGNVGAGIGRVGDKITSVFGNVASEITGKQVFSPNSAHSIVVEALEKVRTSEALAKRIWMSFVVEGKDSLSLDDIEEVLGPLKKEEAAECFSAIDADQNGDISLEEMVRKVVDVGVERKAIANSMKDISQALTAFDDILLFAVVLIVVFVFLAFFQSSFITTLATASTALLSLSFVFAVTAQEFLGSCIFLFVKHPYDVGDRVDITGPEKEQLIVERISLLYTVFTRIDKMQVVQVPNIVLNNAWVENVTRSKAMKEVIDVNISYDTSFEDIELLRLEMEKFVRHPDNSRDFQPDFSIGVGGVGDLDKMNLKIVIKHKSNWHNDAVRATRRSKFICALAIAMKKVPIYGPGGGGEPLGGPMNPSYSVAVSDSFAIASRAKFDEDKEKQRMVPTNPPGRSASSASRNQDAERKAAQELNTQNPAYLAAASAGVNRDAEPSLSSPSYDDMDERRRNNDIESIRADLMGKPSQRGRRQAGQALPPSSPLGESHPKLTLTREISNQLTRERTNPRTGTFDIESQRATAPSSATGFLGSSTSPPPPPTSNNPFYASTPYLQQQQTGYSVFPRQGSPPGTSSGASGMSPPPPAADSHPLQSAPTGARSRGASVSRPPQHPPPPPGSFGPSQR